MLLAVDQLLPILYNIALYAVAYVALVAMILKGIEYALRRNFRHVETGKMIPGASLCEISYRVCVLSWFYTTHLCEEIKRIQDQCGPLFHCFAGISGHSIITAKPEHVGKILRQTSMYPKHNIFTSKQLNHFWGDNLLVVEGDVWKRQRSVMNKGFYDIEKFMNIFSKKVALCLEQWDSESPIMSKKHIGVTTFPVPELADKENSKSVPMKVYVKPFTQKMALDVLGCTIFGYDFHYLQGEMGEYLDAYNYVMSNAFNLIRTVFQFVNSLPAVLYPPNKTIDSSAQKFDELAYMMIAKARQNVLERAQKRNSSTTANAAEEEEEEMTLLEQMIDAVPEEGDEGTDCSALTDKELRDNICILFIAGHETTSLSLSFALYHLAKDPVIQEKARQEVFRVVGKDQIPTYEQLKDLDYITNIINECMRMYPPIGILNGRLQQKSQVFDGYKLPKNSILQIFIYGLHHNKEVWGDPENFRPERFEPAESKTRHPASFIPFSAGPRTCIGNKFAMCEMRLFISMLLQRYTLHLPPGEENKKLEFDRTNVLVGPKNDLGVVFKRLN